MDSSIAVSASLILVGIAGIGLAIPLLGNKVPRNPLYGFRTKRTLSSDEIWYPANRLAAKWMLGWGAVNGVVGVATLSMMPYSQKMHWLLMGVPLTIVPIMVGLMIWVERKFGTARKS